MQEWGFLIFEFFCYRFRNFLPRVWSEFGTKIFFFFSSYLILFWLKIILERGILFIFFAIFFQNFLPRAMYERNSGLKFFSLFRPVSSTCWRKIILERGFLICFFSFSAYLISFWLKIMPEWGFLIFEFFYNRFRNFLPRVEYERNSGLNFFFSISRPISSRLGYQ